VDSTWLPLCPTWLPTIWTPDYVDPDHVNPITWVHVAPDHLDPQPHGPRPRGTHMTPTWRPRGDHVVSRQLGPPTTWPPRGPRPFGPSTKWPPREPHVPPTWPPRDTHEDPTQHPITSTLDNVALDPVVRRLRGPRSRGPPTSSLRTNWTHVHVAPDHVVPRPRGPDHVANTCPHVAPDYLHHRPCGPRSLGPPPT